MTLITGGQMLAPAGTIGIRHALPNTDCANPIALVAAPTVPKDNVTENVTSARLAMINFLPCNYKS
jgi:hypothetical protein